MIRGPGREARMEVSVKRREPRITVSRAAVKSRGLAVGRPGLDIYCIKIPPLTLRVWPVM